MKTATFLATALLFCGAVEGDIVNCESVPGKTGSLSVSSYFYCIGLDFGATYSCVIVYVLYQF